MATSTFAGSCGILSGTVDWDEIRRKREAERKAEQAAAKRVSKQQQTCDEIDASLSPHLRKELSRENKTARISAEQKKDFAEFQKCCARWELPHLPAPPQAVAVFLSEQSERERKHVLRLRNSISTVHRAFNFTDPCDDILVRAVVRLVRDEKPQTDKGN